MVKEIGYQLVTSHPGASRQEVTKQTHISPLPASSPAAESSAKPQTVKITTRQTLYLPYQALSLPIIPARRQLCEENATVAQCAWSSRRSFARCQAPGSHAVTRIAWPAVGAQERPRRIAYL